MVSARLLVVGTLVGCLGLHFQTAGADAGGCTVGDSLFQKKYYYPYVWWVVYPADVPGVANTALTLRSALTSSPESFAEQVLLGIARNQSQDIAKSIGGTPPLPFPRSLQTPIAALC